VLLVQQGPLVLPALWERQVQAQQALVQPVLVLAVSLLVLVLAALPV